MYVGSNISRTAFIVAPSGSSLVTASSSSLQIPTVVVAPSVAVETSASPMVRAATLCIPRWMPCVAM